MQTDWPLDIGDKPGYTILELRLPAPWDKTLTSSLVDALLDLKATNLECMGDTAPKIVAWFDKPQDLNMASRCVAVRYPKVEQVLITND